MDAISESLSLLTENPLTFAFNDIIAAPQVSKYDFQQPHLTYFTIAETNIYVILTCYQNTNIEVSINRSKYFYLENLVPTE